MEEKDIRPASLLNRYLELSRIDAEACFSKVKRIAIPCPACNSDEVSFAFEKWGFQYTTCQDCRTLFQSPRPSKESFETFYLDSPSAKFWSNEFFPAVAESRRKHLFEPKVRQIAQLCMKRGFFPGTLIDAGAGYGLFLEEWKKKYPETRLIAIEPNEELSAVCGQKGLDVIRCFAEDSNVTNLNADMVVSLEVIEHVYDPLSFCKSLSNLVREKGKVLLTGLSVDGFDIQVLGENSKSVSPPHHLNFFSISGFKKLMERAGFKNIQVTTPGNLDVSIVRNAFRENSDVLNDQSFIRHLVNQDSNILESFQEFLRENQLSSHCWVLAEK